MDWMIIEPPSLQEELYVEATFREIYNCKDIDKLHNLCAQLTKQSWHQGKLLKQAVEHIASLDKAIAPV